MKYRITVEEEELKAFWAVLLEAKKTQKIKENDKYKEYINTVESALKNAKMYNLPVGLKVSREVSAQKRKTKSIEKIQNAIRQLKTKKQPPFSALTVAKTAKMSASTVIKYSDFFAEIEVKRKK